MATFESHRVVLPAVDSNNSTDSSVFSAQAHETSGTPRCSHGIGSEKRVGAGRRLDMVNFSSTPTLTNGMMNENRMMSQEIRGRCLTMIWDFVYASDEF